jgi:S-adenosylmethionine:tRNA ribosyltransferase-isomerase
MNGVRVEDFDYELPMRLIAQKPLENRADSRLMVIDPVTQEIQHRHFYEIQEFLRPGDVLVLNNSKVLPARLYGVKEDTGAKVELLLLHQTTDGMTWSAMAKPAKRLKEGTKLIFRADDTESVCGSAVVTKVLDEGIREVRFEVNNDSFESFLNQVGSMPLPPYIHATLEDKTRYQTVYAKTLGSVAAPTAGLHFTESLLNQLREFGVEVRFVTLHVGLGTFRPVQVDTVEGHHMHSEWYEVDEETAAAVRLAKVEGRRVIAVGTTALRTLESSVEAGQFVAGARETDIFIYPGYKFRTADALITNFHLPKSTLFMLVCTWMGTEFARHVYQEAVTEEYRFFSFGDAMFLTRRGEHS